MANEININNKYKKQDYNYNQQILLRFISGKKELYYREKTKRLHIFLFYIIFNILIKISSFTEIQGSFILIKINAIGNVKSVHIIQFW